ncbi:hypothetical protein GCM10010977_32660 [Citricoccus zhacaiensis]|uniref:Ester cyclase n=3 Tax=Citricoccus TaxID=169133 RepID=A0ABV5G920_9MICC|nr:MULTISPECIES: ester cyclase [Citricoccus]GGO49841.1 hypothetical protein GCM10010977_32660 [Citricoccus zhacaiensis]VXC20286.1 SnoaL-like polyketide cyclase [Citricoccus sp. K5]
MPAPDDATRSAHAAVTTRLVEEVLVGGNLGMLDRLYTPALAPVAHRWIAPFHTSFPDVRMQIVQLVREEDTVAARFRCSGIQLGPWRGHAPTGRRFENIDEAYLFTFREGLIAKAWGLADTLERFRRLGLRP